MVEGGSGLDGPVEGSGWRRHAGTDQATRGVKLRTSYGWRMRSELQGEEMSEGRGCAWPRAASKPPRPIPNRVVPGASAGEYCAGDRVGGEAAARTDDPRSWSRLRLTRMG